MKKTFKLLIMLLFFTLCFSSCGKITEIDINSYVEVEFEGNDMLGFIADYEFDAKEMLSDYEKELKDVSKKDLRNLLEDAISFDVSSYLSNGDKITVTWDIDEDDLQEFEKENKVKLVFEDFTLKVKGLEEMALVGGDVLNIYCWNSEFMDRVSGFYPGYEWINSTEGRIGDVIVRWHIIPAADNAYQNTLDSMLLSQSNAYADDKVDLFLVEPDYAMKYTDSVYTMPMEKLGITQADLTNQYQYTLDVGTNSDGILKGLSWQGCPGAMFYNREAAIKIFGTDDPAVIQSYVKDWDSFMKTADMVQQAGYKMTASVFDTYRTYSNNVTSRWVVDGKINIDPNIAKWVTDSKKLVDAGQTGTENLWSVEWSEGFYPDGKVFCYFGPAWLVNYSMAADNYGSIGYNGGWGATEGPQGFFWGGTWICAATGTDNTDLIKDILLKLTADEDIMSQICYYCDDYVNNTQVMSAMAETDYASRILGYQNPLEKYHANAERIRMNQKTSYDATCNEEFQDAMKNYFEGTMSYEEALNFFYRNVTERHPELNK